MFVENLPGLVILAALAQMAENPLAERGWVNTLLRFRVWLLAGMLYCAGLLLLVSNCQLERLPLQELLPLLFLDCILQCSWLDARYQAALCAGGPA